MLEVTARSAADILSIQPNSAILFYHKIRVINYLLSLEADEIFEGKIELDENYCVVIEKEKEEEERLEKSLYLVF